MTEWALAREQCGGNVELKFENAIYIYIYGVKRHFTAVAYYPLSG